MVNRLILNATIGMTSVMTGVIDNGQSQPTCPLNIKYPPFSFVYLLVTNDNFLSDDDSLIDYSDDSYFSDNYSLPDFFLDLHNDNYLTSNDDLDFDSDSTNNNVSFSIMHCTPSEKFTTQY